MVDGNLLWGCQPQLVYPIYLDDIVILLEDMASHLQRLKAMFQKLQQAGMKLKPSNASYSAGKLHTWGTLSLPRE